MSHSGPESSSLPSVSPIDLRRLLLPREQCVRFVMRLRCELMVGLSSSELSLLTFRCLNRSLKEEGVGAWQLGGVDNCEGAASID